MVESTALEMRRTGNRTVGSNPTLSASRLAPLLDGNFSRTGGRMRRNCPFRPIAALGAALQT